MNHMGGMKCEGNNAHVKGSKKCHEVQEREGEVEYEILRAHGEGRSSTSYQQGVMQSYDKCMMKYCIMKEKMLWFNSG